MENLRRSCHLPLAGGVIETTKGKVSCLLQAYISRSYIESHSLISDLMYIAQNATRIGRGLFEYALKRGWPMTALNLLKICKMLELQAWNFQSPFRHFDLPPQVIARLEECRCSIEQIDIMTPTEIGKLVNFPDKMGETIKDYLKQLPYVIVEGEVKPIKSNLLSLKLMIQPYFKWNDRYHGKTRQSFWLWVVDEEITQQIYYSEHIKFSKQQVQEQQSQILNINIPLVDESFEDGVPGQRVPNEYIVFVLSDEWNGCDYEFPIECRKITLPDEPVAYTKVPPNLNQLPLTVIQNEMFAPLFRSSSTTQQSPSTSHQQGNSRNHHQQTTTSISLQVESFNTLQSQVFYPLYHCDRNLLICGPTGSGKTVLADIATLRVLRFKKTSQKQKIVFITPIESLAHLKYHDWKERIGENLQKRVLLLNDHTLFDDDLFNQSDIIVSSAEKFYIWMTKTSSIQILQNISLVILDDLHLMSEKKGSSLELIIARLNHVKLINTRIRCRYVGISNTVANAQDLANWLNVKKNGVYNFHPATARPIQLEIHISSFPERHYSPRMSTMNKPIFKAILTHSPTEPVLIFVSSKKQCSLTALDLISCLVHHSQSREKQWLHIDQSDLDSILAGVQEENLKLSLEFGIGFLYPGLRFNEKRTVEELYLYNKIQVLICTANYAWESSYRGRMVIVKGTEHYDNETGRFVDYPPADVMQMLGKAGRPNQDSTGISILMIRDIYKEFYKKFLYEPFPVESNLFNLDDIVLRNFLTSGLSEPQEKTQMDSINAGEPGEPEAGHSKSKHKQDPRLLNTKKSAMKMLSSTFLARRITKNPSYYGLNDCKTPEEFLSRYLDDSRILNEN